MPDIGNFIAQNVRGPDYGNILAKAENLKAMREQNVLAQRRNQQAQEEQNALASGDLNALARVNPTMARDSQGFVHERRKYALDRIAQVAKAIAGSKSPRVLLAQAMQMPDVLESLQVLGVDPAEFGPGEGDTDESVAAEAAEFEPLYAQLSDSLEQQKLDLQSRNLDVRAMEIGQRQDLTERGFDLRERELEGRLAEPRQAPSGYRYTETGDLEFVPGGPADPAVASSNRNLRPIPAAASNGIIANRSALAKIETAIAAVQQHVDDVNAGTAEPAFGLWNKLGDTIRQRTDPKGVGPRALVSDIGSLKIHDRSGAAVTAAETPRLKPFVPDVNDTPEKILTNLENFRNELLAQVDEVEAFYSEESGYRQVQPRVGGNAADALRTSAPEMPSVGEVMDGYRYIGGDPSQESSWEYVGG